MAEILETGEGADVLTGSDIIRCPHDAVVTGSHNVNPLGYSEAYIYSEGNYGDDFDQLNLIHNTVGENLETISCEKQMCDPHSLIDSDYEFSPLVDEPNQENINVTCNDGYVFKYNQLKHGNVRCDYLPITESDQLKYKNEMAWVVDDPYMDNICGLKETEIECNIPHQDPIHPHITHNCVWQPGLSNDGLTQGARCLYRERVDLSENPVCEARYCHSRQVSNSNRVAGIDGPLPGPDTGRLHGSCVSSDDTVHTEITNSSDCNCFKHKSCDTCTSSEDCQWCGSQLGQGRCYSIKTHNQLCEESSIRTNSNGVCITIDTDEITSNISEDECIPNRCINIQSGETVDETTEEECIGNNNTFYSDLQNQTYESTRILENKVLNRQFLQGTLATPLVGDVVESDGNTIKTQEYICKGIDGYSSECSEKTTISDCIGGDPPVSCEWILNPFRDTLYRWNENQRVIIGETIDGTINETSHNLTNSNTINDYIFIENDNATDTIQLDPTTRHKFSQYFCETIMDGDYDNDFCPGFKYCLDEGGGGGDCGGQTTELILDNGTTVSGCIYTDSNIYGDENFRCFVGGTDNDISCSADQLHNCTQTNSSTYSNTFENDNLTGVNSDDIETVCSLYENSYYGDTCSIDNDTLRSICESDPDRLWIQELDAAGNEVGRCYDTDTENQEYVEYDILCILSDDPVCRVEDPNLLFDYNTTLEITTTTGICKSDITNDIVEGDTREVCEYNNNEFVPYQRYSDVGTCSSIEDTGNPDLPTYWAGGGIRLDDDGETYQSDCTANLLSTCNVECNVGFGGGGEYLCHYNNNGSEICNRINNISDDDIINKSELCNRYPSCNYSNNMCEYVPGSEEDGFLEWIGTPCYRLNNEAFSHGISAIADLDEVLPPFIRVLLFFIVAVIILIPLSFASVYYIIRYTGVGLDKIFNTSFSTLDKVLSSGYTPKDLPILVKSSMSNITHISSDLPLDEKIVYLFIFPVALSIISYILFRIFKRPVDSFIERIVHYLQLLPQFVVYQLSKIRVSGGGIDFDDDESTRTHTDTKAVMVVILFAVILGIMLLNM